MRVATESVVSFCESSQGPCFVYKARRAQWTASSLFPPHERYAEAYIGGAAFYLMGPHASSVEGCPDALIGAVAFPSFEDVRGTSFSRDRKAVAHLIKPVGGFTNGALSMD